MKAVQFLIVFIPLYAEASIISDIVDKVSALRDKLDSLKVTWSINPFNSNAFDDLPRTVSEAVADGWVLNASCSDSNPFLGNRYIKDEDTSAMPLFDSNGYIAGLQVGVPKNIENGFPSERQRPPFVENGNMYVFSVYFVEPSTICSSGRTNAQFEEQGTATGLWIQNSTSPLDNLVKAPANESLAVGTAWTKGKCFRSMGVHYWYNISVGMDCKDFQPIFLLYNGGKLNAFGWALVANVESPRYEHPPSATFGAFMQEAPTCLSTSGTISTMHIYLSSNPVLDDWC